MMAKEVNTLIEERKEPLKNIFSFYVEVRKQEEIDQAKAAEAVKADKPLTQEEQIKLLSEAVLELSNQLNKKVDAE